MSIVDTRTQKEYDNEHMRGAVLASYVEKSLKETDFDANKDDFGALKTIAEGQAAACSCATVPSAGSRTRPRTPPWPAGYIKIYWFRGGMPEWREKHLPVEGIGGRRAGQAAGPAARGGVKTVAAVTR